MDKDIKLNNKILEEKIRAFKNICYDSGMRITPQRIAIYKELITSLKHPSASMIYDRVRSYFPNISLGTVNSTLLTFAEIGLTKVLESSGDPKRFDPNLKEHHHFRCIKCGRIIDFYNEDFDSIKIPDEIKKRFVVLDKKVHLEGICEKCRAKK
jgi:Fur family peroxide stress response transcriptional regulator